MNTKKIISLLSIFAAFLLALTACGGAGNNPAQPREISDEEIIAKYWQAFNAYSWFETYTIAYDSSDFQLHKENKYYRVTYENIGSLAQLRAYLETIFLEETVDMLLAFEDGNEKFIEVDGVLYVSLKSRSSVGYRGSESFEVVRTGDKNLLNLVVSFDLLDKDFNAYDTQSVTFIMEYIDAMWRFTNFTFIR